MLGLDRVPCSGSIALTTDTCEGLPTRKRPPNGHRETNKWRTATLPDCHAGESHSLRLRAEPTPPRTIQARVAAIRLFITYLAAAGLPGTANAVTRADALIMLLFVCTLRRAEITGLGTADIDTRPGAVTGTKRRGRPTSGFG